MPSHLSTPFPLFLSSTSPLSMLWLYTTAAIVIALLVLEQSVYRYKKGRLPGDRWTIPLIGKFAESLNPSMEAYKRQWNSGDLSDLLASSLWLLRTPMLARSSTLPHMLSPVFLTPLKLSFFLKIGEYSHVLFSSPDVPLQGLPYRQNPRRLPSRPHHTLYP